MTHIVKTVTKPITNLIDAIPGGNIIAPIALTALGQPELAAAFSGVNTLNNGGSLGKALLSGGLSYGGAALGGDDTVFGDSLSSGVKDALSGVGDSLSGALGNVGDATGLTGVYNDASGALGNAYSSVSNTLGNEYNGSDLQDAFNSGSDALKSVGLGSGSSNAPVSTNSSALAPQGGGGSSYSSNVGTFGQDPNNTSALLTGGNSGALPSIDDINGLDKPLGDLNFDPSQSTLSPTSTSGSYKDFLNPGGKVASSSNSYLSPLASIGIGALSNNSAQNALLKQAGANKSLLAPYLNFQFNPGDLTQDPGYQFDLAQGNQALDRKALAPGGSGYFSGAALKDAESFGTGLADNTYSAAFNRALQSNNAGLSGALATAGVNDSIGNTNAASDINMGNLFSGALGNVLGGNSYTNNGSLSGGSDIQAILRNLLSGKTTTNNSLGASL